MSAEPPSVANKLRRLRSRENAESSSKLTSRLGTPTSSSLAERLSVLSRTRLDTRAALKATPPIDEFQLATALHGHVLAEGLIRIETRLPMTMQHGSSALQPVSSASLTHFGENGGSPVIALDTETTGLSGGTGTVPFLVGVASASQDGSIDELVVTQFLMTRFIGEISMLTALTDIFQRPFTLLSYNGKAFDIPLLQARYRLGRLCDPLASVRHLDMLPAIRRAYSASWPRCTLGMAERELLGFERRHDIPGVEIPEVWLRWLRLQETCRLPEVLAHNCADLVSLYLLPNALADAEYFPSGSGAAPSAGAQEHLRRGDIRGAIRHLQANRNALDVRGKRLLARLAERQNQRATAMVIWDELAACNDTEALERLAVHYEHRASDPLRALAYCRRLIDAAPPKSRHLGAYRHRHARLIRKTTALDTRFMHGDADETPVISDSQHQRLRT